MRYKPREGVVGTVICGMLLLIPSRAVYHVCNSIQKIPPQWAMLWMMLEKGESVEKIYAFYQRMFRMPEDVCREKVDAVLSGLYQKGYLEEAADPNEDTQRKQPDGA